MTLGVSEGTQRRGKEAPPMKALDPEINGRDGFPSCRLPKLPTLPAFRKKTPGLPQEGHIAQASDNVPDFLPFTMW